MVAGCREEPGRCSGREGRLCVEATLEPGLQEADALLLSATADTGQRIEVTSLPGVRQAFADRKRYVAEIDLHNLDAAARRLDLTRVALRGGMQLAAGMGSWSRGDGMRPLVILLRRVQPDQGMGPAWKTGQAATATLGGTLLRLADVCWSGSRL